MLHQVPSTADLQARVVARAATDPAFRQQLLATPKPTLEQALGITLPPSLEVVIMEETASRLCLVLPARALTDHELSDEQLAAASGGTLPIPLPMPALIPGPLPMPAVMPEPLPMPASTFRGVNLKLRRR
jgi:hypothetical protein